MALDQQTERGAPVQNEPSEGSRTRELTGFWDMTVKSLTVIGSLFFLVTMSFYPIDPWIQRSGFVLFVCVLGLLLYPVRKGDSRRPSFLDLLLIAGVTVSAVYVWLNSDAISERMGVSPETPDLILGAIMIVAVLEVTRRATGLALPILSMTFIVYGLLGKHLPGFLFHRGYSLQRIISFEFGLEGLFSIPTSVASSYVLLFVLFGAVLIYSGTGDAFINLAGALVGRSTGGAGKVGVVSSSFFGTISGSAVANVVATGSLTIPMMKRSGYSSTFSAAVEAVSSTGGQFMPPIMGTAAFVMAEILGVPYSKIALAATIPAVLYFLTVYMVIHFEARKLNLRGLDENAPRVLAVIRKDGPFLLPIVAFLIAMFGYDTSPILAAMIAIVGSIAVSWIRPANRMTLSRILQAVSSGVKELVGIGATCACAGLTIGIIALTGVGGQIGNLVIDAAGTHKLLALVLVMLVVMLLGMGLPTTAAYMVAAAAVAPGMLKLGFDPIAAHLFIVYFACLSAITPPVALAAFAAAGIAKANPMRVGWTAVKFGLTGFIIPFMFVYSPQLLLDGPWPGIVQAVVTSVVGCTALGAGLQGFLQRPLNSVQRAMLVVGGLLMVMPGLATDLAGGALLATVWLWHLRASQWVPEARAESGI